MRDHVPVMSDETTSGVLGGLPHRRPQRRSQKRPAHPAPSSAATEARATGASLKSKPTPLKAEPTPLKAEPALLQAKPAQAKPARAKAKPPRPASRPSPSRPDQVRVAKPAPSPPSTAGPLQTAVQAGAELAEIGLSVSARALRGALSRLPRP